MAQGEPAEEQLLRRLLPYWSETAIVGGRISQGKRNAIWPVHIHHVQYAARLSRRSAAAIDWELELLGFLRSSGMRVPGVLNAHDGRSHREGLSLLTWLSGRPPASTADWAAVAMELERLHSLTPGWTQRPGFRSSRELLQVERGGDIRLDLMPSEAVASCRDAWRTLADEPVSVIHGDPGAGNILISPEGVGFIDWDEARVDASILDLADLPLDLSETIGPSRLVAARRAANAWEAANGWIIEPEYARRRLSRV